MGKRSPGPGDAGARLPTVVDVATAAAVSISTVSRVLAGSAAVRPDLASRVRDAAAALGYVPDRRARALVQRRSRSIGAVVPTIDNAIFARAIQALQTRLDADGYRLLLASTEYDQARELESVQALVEHGVDAMVMVGADHHPGVQALLDARRVPAVRTWTYDAASPVPTVGFDNRAAMHRLVRHLLDLGHRRVAMIAGVAAGNDRAAARIEGVREALAAAGLDPVAVVERPYRVPEGRAATRALMLRAPAPTAIVCGNDVLAFGALAELHAMGIAVPHAVSVTGFDDLDLASHVVPPLTTMHVPSAAMGTLAAEHVLARVAGRDAAHAIALEAELIVRGSTGPAPAR